MVQLFNVLSSFIFFSVSRTSLASIWVVLIFVLPFVSSCVTPAFVCRVKHKRLIECWKHSAMNTSNKITEYLEMNVSEGEDDDEEEWNSTFTRSNYLPVSYFLLFVCLSASAFIVCFALVMLNTDQHDPRLRSGKSSRKPMTLEQFISNLRGVDDGNDFPRPFLTEMFQSIRNESIEWKEEPKTEKETKKTKRKSQTQCNYTFI